MPDAEGSFHEIERLHEQMERMWKRLTGGLPGRPGFCLPVLEPPTDVFETDDQVVVVAEIAGIGEEEVEIEVEGDRLAYRGEKSDRRADPHQRHAQIEICYGLFERVLALPAPVDPDKAEVSYEDGFLRIALPKLARRRSHHVRVTVRHPSE
jgi:HSP20 family protein